MMLILGELSDWKGSFLRTIILLYSQMTENVYIPALTAAEKMYCVTFVG
jgi:hypothetical protein